MAGLLGYGLRAVDYFYAVPGNLGDARFNSVILEHLFKYVTSSGIRLWSPPFFYPFEGTLAFSDSHFGSALPYVLLRSFGAGRELAFNGWFLFGLLLNFICAYVAIKRIGFSEYSAAAGAFAFSFALPVLAQEGHAQLTYRFAIPLAFGAFLAAVSEKRLDALWRVVFWTVVQFFCSIYLGVFLAFLLLAGTLCAVVMNPEARLSLVLPKPFAMQSNGKKFFVFVVMLISLSSLTWLLWNYYSVASIYKFKRSWDEVATMLPRLSSYLIADNSLSASWVGDGVTEIPMRHEHQMFLGISVWALMLVGGVAAWTDNSFKYLGKLTLISLVVMFLGTLMVGGASLYRLIFDIPGLGAIRAVSRIVLVMMMPISILVAIGTQYVLNHTDLLANRFSLLLRAFVLIVLSAEVVAFQPNNTPISVWTARQSELRKLMPAQLPPGSIIYVTGNSPDPFHEIELDGMILAQDLGHPTLNGYSGNFPPNYLEPRPCISHRHRIESYMAFGGIPRDSRSELAERVVVVATGVCNHLPD